MKTQLKETPKAQVKYLPFSHGDNIKSLYSARYSLHCSVLIWLPLFWSRSDCYLEMFVSFAEKLQSFVRLHHFSDRNASNCLFVSFLLPVPQRASPGPSSRLTFFKRTLIKLSVQSKAYRGNRAPALLECFVKSSQV